jgi:glucose/arabinose dehydrogenase
LKRPLLLVLLLALAAAGASPARSSASSAAVSTPAITEPATDGQVISPYDVHMVAGPFAGSPGESHACTDWEIRNHPTDELVWSAPCVTGSGLVHVHLGDGSFAGSLEGRHQLSSSSSYRLRVRFLGDGPPEGSDWSDWAIRPFQTTAASGIRPLVLSDASVIPTPHWRDEAGGDVILPAPQTSAASLRLDVQGGGTALRLAGGDGVTNVVTNPEAVPAHGAVRAIVEAGTPGLSLPATVLSFTDGSGQDREIHLPPVDLDPGESAAFWIGEGGGAFTDASGGAPQAAPDFSAPLNEPPVPWAVRQPGFRIERFATGLRLPVNVAFVPSPGPGADDPFFYVTELYGSIKVVTRSGAVSDYATSLLNFDPTGGFPGTGEKGLAGIVVEPATGDLFVSSVYALAGETNFHFPEVRRLHSEDGGRTASSNVTVLQFPGEPMGASHQSSSVSIGPDGKLYVHIGDGLLTSPAQDLESVRGKILRVDLDGSAPADNPFYDAADGLRAKDLVFALGLRNPFGGAWRESDGALWEVENGPATDRIAKVVAGRNYGWDGTDQSMHTFAAHTWFPSHAPVNLAFTQLSTFAGSGFPAEKLDHAFVTESGPTYAPGPSESGKRISEFVLDAAGNRVRGPDPLVEYAGAGRGTAAALAAGPDGLYFSDLYKNFGAATPTDAGASVFRVFWTGLADFTADAASGESPLTVRFRDASNVPAAAAWHWEFGDGASSDEKDPVHVYFRGGRYDVRLTVTGAGGEAYRQKASFVVVAPPVRLADPLPPARPTPRILEPR